VIGDETRNLSGKEQFAISIRWVTHNYIIHEDLVALAEVEQTDGATELKKYFVIMSYKFLGVVVKFMIELQTCRDT